MLVQEVADVDSRHANVRVLAYSASEVIEEEEGPAGGAPGPQEITCVRISSTQIGDLQDAVEDLLAQVRGEDCRRGLGLRFVLGVGGWGLKGGVFVFVLSRTVFTFLSFLALTL